MRFSTFWLLAALTAAFVHPAFGDHGLDVLKKSQQAQLDAAGTRITTISVDHTTKTTANMIVEFTRSGGMHSKLTVDGQLASEIISDGQVAFVRRDEVDYSPITGNIGQIVADARRSAAVGAWAEMAPAVQLSGHEDVNGAPASIYTFKTENLGLTRTTKVWISDQNNLPLKAEGHVEGADEAAAIPGTRVDRDTAMTFEYDPLLTITLPRNQ